MRNKQISWTANGQDITITVREDGYDLTIDGKEQSSTNDLTMMKALLTDARRNQLIAMRQEIIAKEEASRQRQTNQGE